jgi:hypothetical protein
MIDPMLALSFTLHSGKGTYALLLGSGVSRAAGIPTGWEVTIDLIRKLATLRGEAAEPDPSGWFTKVMGRQPSYDALLEALAKSPADRSALLRAYFEPSNEERARGLKLPTAAHHAVARLVAKGHFRVILTTNFDRLLEHALESEGIVPTVLRAPDDIHGAVPLIHSAITILKLHGDYMDQRLKNTAEELAQYDRRVRALLRRVLEEFGLLICGWSAEWDTALRTELERCPSRRYTTYWAARSEPGVSAKRVIGLRRAELIRIKDADSFFEGLSSQISALEDLDRPHPISTGVAVAQLKRYLVRHEDRIALNDLVMDEVYRLASLLKDGRFPVDGPEVTTETLTKRVEAYEAISATLLALLATGCFWGDESQDPLWIKVVEYLANIPAQVSGHNIWLDLRQYPTLLALYAAGISAIAAERYETLAALLTRPTFMYLGEQMPITLQIHACGVLDQRPGRLLANMKDHYTPLSDRMNEALRSQLRSLLPEENAYQQCFDRFEYLLTLVYADLNSKRSGMEWFPIGRYGWKARGSDNWAVSVVEREAAAAGDHWPPLVAGLFDHSASRFQELHTHLLQHVQRLHWW